MHLPSFDATFFFFTNVLYNIKCFEKCLFCKCYPGPMHSTSCPLTSSESQWTPAYVSIIALRHLSRLGERELTFFSFQLISLFYYLQSFIVCISCSDKRIRTYQQYGEKCFMLPCVDQSFFNQV